MAEKLNRLAPRNVRRAVSAVLQQNQHYGLYGGMHNTAVQFGDRFGIDLLVKDDEGNPLYLRDERGEFVMDGKEKIPLVDLARFNWIVEKFSAFGIEGVRRLRDPDFTHPEFAPILAKMEETIERLLLQAVLDWTAKEIKASPKDPQPFPGWKSSEIKNAILRTLDQTSEAEANEVEDPEKFLRDLFAKKNVENDENTDTDDEKPINTPTDEADNDDADEENEDSYDKTPELRLKMAAIRAALERLPKVGRLMKVERTDVDNTRFMIMPGQPLLRAVGKYCPQSELNTIMPIVLVIDKIQPRPKGAHGGARRNAGRPRV